MNKEIKQKWLEALRSGEYKQGKTRLHNTTDKTFCCLGVLCEVAIKEGVKLDTLEVDAETYGTDQPYRKYKCISYAGESTVLPDTVIAWAGLPDCNPSINKASPNTHDSLASINDRGVDFLAIADLIEANL